MSCIVIKVHFVSRIVKLLAKTFFSEILRVEKLHKKDISNQRTLLSKKIKLTTTQPSSTTYPKSLSVADSPRIRGNAG